MASKNSGLIHTAAGRPVRFGVPDQLNSESPDSWWQEEATKLGLTTEELRRQVALVNEVLAEVYAEERAELG